MRTYVGSHDERGRARVVIVDGAEPPTVAEIVEFLDELAEVSPIRFLGRPHPDPVRRADVLARKRRLIDRLEASRIPPAERELPHLGVHPPDGFGWGYPGSGPSDLAHSLLYRELATEVPAEVYLRFRDDVIARLPAEGFWMPATDVWDWIRSNRELVERHVFGVEAGHPALAVVDDGPDADAAALGGPSASKLVEACEAAWADIRAGHPELPEVVIVLGTGVERGRLVKLGHWWGGRWLADGQVRGEVLLAGEALHLEPKQVFEVLLHEAAHGINAARGVKDTSRGGRYHNQHFATTAREVGLDVKAMPPYGMAKTELAPATEASYGDAITRLGDTMRIARQLQGIRGVGAEAEQEQGAGGGSGGTGADRSRNAPSSTCGCGRKMRMHPATLAKGPVICGVCDTEFTTEASVRQQPVERDPAASNVDDTFMARRRQALRASTDDLRERLLRDRERIATGIDDPVAALEGVEPILTRRLERIDAAVALLEGDKPDQCRPPTDAAGARVERWYERFGTADEQPMVAADDVEREQLSAMARAVLRRDGTIRGRELDLGPLDVAVGDRLVVARPIPDGPPLGTLGDVVSVDVERETCIVDFATWGVRRVEPDSEFACAVTYDYASVDLAQPLDPALALEAERQRALVLEHEL